MKRFLLTLIFLLTAFPAYAEKRNIVASFSILGDITQNVAGDTASVTSLVKVGQDAHTYQPTASDLKQLKNADYIVINGLGFEGWITRAIEASGTKAVVITASEKIKPIEADDHDHGDHHHHDHASVDPHAWHNVLNVKQYAETIAQKLGVDASAYIKQLADLDAEIKKSIATLPAERRFVITSHDAFGYYQAAYGIEFLSPIGFSTESETTPKTLQKLMQYIKDNKVSALFIETYTNNKVLETLAKDTGVTIGGTLYGDALTDASGPAPTYIDLMRHNTEMLVKGIKP